MFKYKVNQIVKAVSGELIYGNGNEILKGISTDTRNLKDEDIFIALKGDNFDAHQFIDKNLIYKVKAIIVEQNVDFKNKVVIRVSNTTTALQKLAKFHRNNHKNVKVIGITGSSGKTSTKDILYNILKEKYNVKKNKGNLNNHIGVPLTLFRIDGDEDFFIVEMGMSQLGEIKLLADIANPQMGIITNVGRSHIEFLKTIENIARAKGELIEALKEGSLAVLNYDNKYTKIITDLANNNLNIKYFGFKEGADYRVIDYKYKNNGMNFILEGENNRIEISSNLIGEHNLYNIVSSIAAARTLNVEWELIKKSLKDIKLTSLRTEIENIDEIKFINDCYNANPLSMKNALKLLKDIKGNKKIAVLGDMLELGDIKEEAHREIGRCIKNLEIDYLITTGELGKYISKAALNSGMNKDNVIHFKDKKQISIYLDEIINKNDVILLKGSRGMKMETIYQDFKNSKE